MGPSARWPLKTPPGFVVRIEAQKAAFERGFRVERGIEGPWIHYASTTAPTEIWIAGGGPAGPWFLAMGLVSFADDGTLLTAVALSPVAGAILDRSRQMPAAIALTPAHQMNMRCHRSRHGFPVDLSGV